MISRTMKFAVTSGVIAGTMLMSGCGFYNPFYEPKEPHTITVTDKSHLEKRANKTETWRFFASDDTNGKRLSILTDQATYENIGIGQKLCYGHGPNDTFVFEPNPCSE